MRLNWLHQFQFAGYSAALAQGYYREEGLDVDIHERDPQQDVVLQVFSGQAYFAVGDSSIVSNFDEALATIPQQENNALINPWMGLKIERGINTETLIKYVAAVLVLFVLLSAYWISRLRKEVAARRESESRLIKISNELATSRNLLQTIIEALPLRVFWKDRESRYLGCNSTFAKDAGKSHPDELIGLDDRQLGWRDQASLYRADDRQVMESGIAKLAFEEPQTTPDGQPLWLRTSKTPLRNGDNEIIGVLGVYEDITGRIKAEQALKRTSDNLRNAQSIAKLGNWSLDLMTNEYEASEEALRILALPPGSSLSLEDFDALVHPDDRQRFLEYRIDASRTKNSKGDIEYRIVTNGHTQWVHSIFHVITDRDGRAIRVFGTLQDITERKLVDEERQLASLVYQNSSEAMMVTDADNRILATNPAFSAMTGYAPAEMLGQNPRRLSSGRQDAVFFQAMWEALNSTGHWEGEIWNQRKNGEEYAEWLTINTIYAPSGAVHRRVALFSDITARKAADALIWNQANLDPLTQLPNRRLFTDRLAQEIKKAHREGTLLGLLFLDLDRFKEVNDSLGHPMGDLLLIEAARRIRHVVRESDTVARLGGDEFTVILPEVGEVSDLERIAQSLIDTLIEPFRLGEEQVYVSASIGITVYPHDALTPEGLFKHADQAMYAAKREGRNRYHYFTPTMQEDARERMRLIHDLHQALATGQFYVHYQPIVELTSGRIRKAEALLRWRHPQRGEVGPATFIPVAEDSGLIHDLGDWIFLRAADQVKDWRARFAPDFQISVNKSPVQFQATGDGHNHWVEHLRALDLDGGSLVVEITEGLLLKANSHINGCLLNFRDAGIQVAIDDFGTGYSSLAYLNEFDIDYLKIDQSFTHRIAPGSSELALSEAIVVMAHALGLKVIAEGVETEAQRALLAGMGCDYAQGYLFSKPVAAEDFEKLLSAERF